MYELQGILILVFDHLVKKDLASQMTIIWRCTESECLRRGIEFFLQEAIFLSGTRIQTKQLSGI